MEVRENTAGRLYDILSQAKKMPDNKSIRQMWAEMFNLDYGDVDQILLIIADLIVLARNAKEEVERLVSVDHELYLRPFNNIERVLKITNLDTPWSNMKGTLDDSTMYGLQFCSDTLGRKRGTLKVEEDKITAIQEEIEEITDKVIDLELPDNIKKLIILNLDKIRDALITYRIKGIDGLQIEVERTIGSLYVHQKEIEDAKNEPKVKEAFSKFFLALGKINEIIGLAKNTKEMAIPFIKQLIDM